MAYRLIAQEHSMGCAVACVASILDLSYKNSLRSFKKENVSTKGYYLRDIISALKNNGLRYKGSKITNKTRKYIDKMGSIVFIKRSKKYPAGHYLLKTDKGWMNPWINFPNISPAKAGFQKKLIGEPQWIIFRTSL